MPAIHKFKGGDTFHDRYTLEKLIGVGGFADVWKAVDNMTGAIVALKIYTNLDEDGMKDLAREYTGMQSLNHTNILRAEHFDNWGNVPYLVMKYCGGGSLDKKIGKLSDDEIKEAMKQVATGLQYLHENGIVHQDIKPANILIDNSHSRITYVLSDFGISSKTKTRLSHSVNIKQQGFSMTEAYAPPEKFSSKKEDRRADRKGDIFSFGISVYELVVGNLPFDDLSTGRQLQYGDAEIDFDDIKEPSVRRVIEQCMEPSKEDRPDAGEIIDMLNGGGNLPPIDTGRRDTDQSYDDRRDVHNSNAGTEKKTIKVQDKKSKGMPKWPLILIIALVVGVGCFFLFRHLTGNTSGYTAYADPSEETATTTVIDTVNVNGVTVEMVRIQGGEFRLGNDEDSIADACERPVVDRTVRDFYLGKYEVTQELWEAVMGKNPSTKKGKNLPVNNVSIRECQEFITKLNALTGRNFRLPTEVEWEYAAKVIPNPDGTVSSIYKTYAGGNRPDDYAFYSANSGGTINEVGQKKPNPMGLYDMNGNVIEWCSSIFTDYGTGEPIGQPNEFALRGGYYDSDAAAVRNTSRGSSINQNYPAFGMRLAL
ncbi:MAG: SUMF1/EgtB/PvdO family nonheme iron enzyme [Muribaculaceae bacterium]|nr:SUMF1/EgtB/PvdO family nonheme iron enzyme [Muribaculaceae bacterium]